MDYQTELVGEDVILVSTDNSGIVTQLEQNPAAELVERDDARAKFRMPLRDFELHFPSDG